MPVQSWATHAPWGAYTRQRVLCTRVPSVIFDRFYANVVFRWNGRINPGGYEQRWVKVHFWNKNTKTYDIETGWGRPFGVEGPIPSSSDDLPTPYVQWPFYENEDNLRRTHYLVGIQYFWYWRNTTSEPWKSVSPPTHWLQPHYLAPYSEYGNAFGFDQPDCDTIQAELIPVRTVSTSSSLASSSDQPLRRLARTSAQLQENAPSATTVPLRASEVDQTCFGRTATILGTDDSDVLEGTPGSDVIAGATGDDVIRGRGGADFICGGAGEDGLLGGPGADRITGESDNDVLLGETGTDVLLGGDGVDIMEGGLGADRMDGGGQSLDILSYLFSPRGVHVDFGAGRALGEGGLDRFEGFNAVVGSNRGDVLLGTSGEQWFVPFGGNDSVDGGHGVDVLAYLLAEQGVSLSLDSGHAFGEGTDTLAGLEVVFGSSQDDSISGGPKSAWLFGDAGNDTLDGFSGGTVEGDDGTDSCFNGDFYQECENQGDGVVGPALDVEPPSDT